MLYQARNGTVAIGGQTMRYIRFGSGDKALIMLPGLGDGMRTVKGMAIPFALMHRIYAKRYNVYVFSRADQLEKSRTTRDMADDVRLAMDALDIPSASVVGVSQGGMIAQYLALDHPARVEKLMLAVTLSRPNRTVESAVTTWLAMARRGDYRGIMRDTAERSYSEAYLRAHRRLLPLLGLAGKPKDFSRFIMLAEACLTHNAYARLGEIQCPTLILGASADRIVGAEASVEMADQIGGSELYLYDGLGHAAYDEAKDFHPRILAFLTK